MFGKPLICSDIPPNMETLKLLHLKIVESSNPSELAAAFDGVLEDRDGICEKSQQNTERVKVLDWEVIAAEYVAICRHLSRTR